MSGSVSPGLSGGCEPPNVEATDPAGCAPDDAGPLKVPATPPGPSYIPLNGAAAAAGEAPPAPGGYCVPGPAAEGALSAAPAPLVGAAPEAEAGPAMPMSAMRQAEAIPMPPSAGVLAAATARAMTHSETGWAETVQSLGHDSLAS